MTDPAEKDATRSYPILAQIGSSGIQQSSGFIMEEYLPELRGERGRKIFHEMETNDSTIGAVLFAITTVLRSVKWKIHPAEGDNSQEAIDAAELVEGMLLRDMQHTWPEFIDSACSMFVYGFAVHEIIWKKRSGADHIRPWRHSDFDDGLWGIRSLSGRSQRSINRWIFDEEENLVGFEQTAMNKQTVVVPMHRCLHFRTSVGQNNPEGRSIIRPAYRSYRFLKRLQEIEGIGSERDLVGYPVLRVPSEILRAESGTPAAAARVQYEALIRNVKRDAQEGIILPSDRDENGNLYYEFNLISSGGSRQLRIDEAINRYQRDIARSVLADFIFLGADGGGSLALGKNKTQTFIIALTAFLNHIEAQVNETLIPSIWRLNGLNPDIQPRARADDIEPEDIESLAAYVKSLSDIGYDLASDRELENVLRDKASLPAAPDEGAYDPFAPLPDASRTPRRISAEAAADEDGGDSDMTEDFRGADGSGETDEDMTKAGRHDGLIAAIIEGFAANE